ncbi:uncharacterized protein [Typha latifolia]|uniref:uncharacterized protein n=1 Tax=Typha latifolia TaxID=4733 RepID=UPI003C2CBCC8
MSKTCFTLALLVALASLFLASATTLQNDQNESLRGVNYRWLSQYNPRDATATCDRFPRVCRARGSPGPDCCRKKCVDVMADSLNCGECGRKCHYGETCCGGRCVSVMYDPKNCGSCKNKCKKGSFCNYGMCSYA